MESTWASGAIELLSHADSHIDLKTAFDKRIAYISIDNSVETMIRSYLSLPKSKSGIKVSRKDLEEAGNSFPTLLGLLYSHAADKLVGIDEADVEHYHRIRNTLYHEGTGLSVDDQYLKAYRGIAGVLLKNLFGSSMGPSKTEPDTLERLIVNWNNIEQTIRDRTETKGMFTTKLWEKAVVAGLSGERDLQLLDDLRKARNRLVHSETIDKEDMKYWLEVSEKLLAKIGDSNRLNSDSTENKDPDPSHIAVDLRLFEMAVKAYKKKGSPKYFLDSQELTNEQRSELYDRVIYSEKGRYPKKNPYKKNG